MNSRSGQKAGSNLVSFTKASADRIAEAVRFVEAGNRDASPVVTAPRAAAGAGGKVFRVCTFTGSWNISASKTVTFKYQTSTPNTVVAVNLFANISSGDTASSSAYANCAIARDGTAWFVIAAECDPPADQNYE